MDIESLVSDYQISEEGIRVVDTTKILLLVGISGAGKDTIKRNLLKDESYLDIVSHTTRKKRYNDGILEQDGVDYSFIDTTAAVEMLKEKAFIEAKYVHGTVYGTSIDAVRRAGDTGKIAVTDIDVQGVSEYKDVSQDVMALFILPPDYRTWLDRLHRRYATTEEFKAEWPKRRLSAISELTHALEVSYYHFIINDDLHRAVRVVDEIAKRGDTFNRHDDEARLAARDLLETITHSE